VNANGISDTSMPGAIVFQTVPGGSVTLQERMRINSQGNVGINTSTPPARLSVQGAAGSVPIFDVASSTATSILRVTAGGDVLINTTTVFGANNYVLYVDSGSGSTGYGIGVEGRIQASGIVTSGTLDIAESYFVEPSCSASGTCPESGDVVCAVAGTSATVQKCSSVGDEKVIGVISTNPGLYLGNAPEENLGTRMVALAGRVPVKVSTANGNISVGDKLAPSGIPGVAIKATGEGPTIGIAVADYSDAAVGSVLTFVNLGWKNTLYSGLSVSVSSSTVSVGSLANPYDLVVSKNLIFNNLDTVNRLSFATSTLFESSLSPFAGARAFTFNASGFASASADNYILSVRANNNSVFSVATNGDVHTVGNYFGASAVLGTSTNPGDLAERVDIAIDDNVEAGDVMVVDKNAPDTYRRSTAAYEQSVAGVISTNPTIVVGNGKTDYTAVLAMVGRVPVKVSNENGNIQRGDLLIAASTAGYAMKYDPSKDSSNKMVAVIGVALESFSTVIASHSEAIPADGSDNQGIATSSRSGGTPRNDNIATGKILALIRTGWIYNRDQTINSMQSDITQMATAQGLNLSPDNLPANLNVQDDGGRLAYAGGNLDLQNNLVVNVAGIIGKDNKWRIDEWGNIIQKIATAKGDKEIYGLQSTGKQEVVISGTSTLENGYRKVLLADLDQEIIDKTTPLKVSITMSGETKGVYVTEKNYDSFAVKENNNGQSNAAFDWIVIAKILSSEIAAESASAAAEDTVTETPLVIESPAGIVDVSVNTDTATTSNPSPVVPPAEEIISVATDTVSVVTDAASSTLSSL